MARRPAGGAAPPTVVDAGLDTASSVSRDGPDLVVDTSAMPDGRAEMTNTAFPSPPAAGVPTRASGDGGCALAGRPSSSTAGFPTALPSVFAWWRPVVGRADPGSLQRLLLFPLPIGTISIKSTALRTLIPRAPTRNHQESHEPGRPEAMVRDRTNALFRVVGSAADYKVGRTGATSMWNRHLSTVVAMLGLASTVGAWPVTAVEASRSAIEPPRLVVLEARIDVDGKELAAASTSFPLGTDEQIEMPMSGYPDRLSRLSLRVDPAALHGFVAIASAYLDGREVATGNTESASASLSLELQAEGMRWSLKMKVKRKGRGEDGTPKPLSHSPPNRAVAGRVARGGRPPPALTEPDLWASHPALRDTGVEGNESP